MSFTGNGITSCYPDEVENFISITVLIDDDGRPRYPGEWFWAAMLITTLCMLITSGWFWAHVGNEEHAYRVLNATTGENWVAITEVRNGQPVRIVGQ